MSDDSKSLRPSIIILILVISLVYIPSLYNGFVNWDDDVHVTGNQFIQSLDLEHVVDIFTTTVNKTYIPLTSFTFALENHFFGHDPFVYHFNNLILHICVSIMVFLLAVRFGLPARAALLGAGIFGLHPMHVESVAWITERKDVLYAFFYMLSVLFYCRYFPIADSDNNYSKASRLFLMVLLFGVLSILSKPMALSLPLILCLIDWYFKRKLCARIIFEKLYILAIYVPIAWATYILNVRQAGDEPLKAALTWAWCFVFYLRKFLTMDYFVLFYRLPDPVTLNNISYLSAAIIFLFVIGSLIQFRKKRLYLFSLLFYFLSIFFVLGLKAAHETIVADRFMYLPSVGWCLLLGYAVNRLLCACEHSKVRLILSRILVLSAFSFLSVSTMNQIGVWKSGVTLWGHQLRAEPKGAPALTYQKLAQAYTTERGFDATDQDQFDEVKLLYEKALLIRPNFSNVYHELGNLYFQRNAFMEAEEYLLRTITINEQHAEAYFNLGRLYYKTGRDNKGRTSFMRAIEINPENKFIRQKIDSFYPAN